MDPECLDHPNPPPMVKDPPPMVKEKWGGQDNGPSGEDRHCIV